MSHAKPVWNYHSAGDSQDFRSKPTSFFTAQVFPTARVRGDGVVSSNRRRNSCQRVYLNRENNGATASLTAHEPHLAHEPMVFKGHGYIEYRRPGAQSVAQTTATASA